MLIGDRALSAAKAGLAPFIYDLGTLWHSFSGLPFVFALWIVRRDVVATQKVKIVQLQHRLHKSLRRAMDNLPALAEEVAGDSCLNPKELLAYWQSMSFGLSDDHQLGLRHFFQLAVKYQFLKTLPELNFFDPPFPLTGSH